MTQSGRSNLIESWLADLFAKELIKKKLINPKKDLENLAVDEELDVVGKKIKNEISSITGSGITWKNDEIKSIIKVIRPLEERNFLERNY